jgi:hypothetical protein
MKMIYDDDSTSQEMTVEEVWQIVRHHEGPLRCYVNYDPDDPSDCALLEQLDVTHDPDNPGRCYVILR